MQPQEKKSNTWSEKLKHINKNHPIQIVAIQPEQENLKNNKGS